MEFIEQIVDIALKEHRDHLGDLTVVFPNRRSGLFFKKALSERIDQPVWSPNVLSIADFIKQFSPFKSPDRLTLIFELYQVYRKLLKSGEGFDRFFFWGDVLLRDFDEIDKFMVDAKNLFRNLALQKDLDSSSLEFLNPEQQELIKNFWKSFEGKLSQHQKQFTSIWELLHKIYLQFHEALLEKGLAYDGMIYRWVVGHLNDPDMEITEHHVIFAGFNALSVTEERIIAWLAEQKKATVIWDADDHYLKNEHQEAGFFLREMIRENSVLSETFRASYGNKFIENPDVEIVAVSVASNTGQVQAASNILNKLAQGQTINENTALILPDEKLLFSVLNALPDKIGTLNITMGYPLKESLTFSFVDNLIQLHFSIENLRRPYFYFRHVLDILQHPYVAALQLDQAQKVIKAIKDYNKLYVPGEFIYGDEQLLKNLFQPVNGVSQFIDYIRELLITIAGVRRRISNVSLFSIFIPYLTDSRILLKHGRIQLSGEAFIKLFRQFLYSYRLPFEGEPLQGHQLMGFLETRNLDFENHFYSFRQRGVFASLSQWQFLCSLQSAQSIQPAYLRPPGCHLCLSFLPPHSTGQKGVSVLQFQRKQ